MSDSAVEFLLIDEKDSPILIEEECKNFKPVLYDFIDSYSVSIDKPVDVWLGNKMHEYLPERKSEEVLSMAREIVETIKINEAKKQSLSEAISHGRSKEGWFASEIKKATSGMSTQEASKYLSNLDNALQKANESLYKTIVTQSGNINQNPRLDGFIAEQYHAQTFNLNAEATGSEYRARVLEPTDGYAKNSVDIVVEDANGKIVKRYQVKYCKDAKATEQAFEKGDYRGQQKLIPKDQDGQLSKKATSVIEAPDGTKSNPLTKARAEEMKNEAQSGQWNELNWNEYNVKDLAIGIGKQAGHAAIQGVCIGVGFDVAQKLFSGEKVKAEEVIEKAVVSGADFGIKAAAAGALKVGVEKEIIKVIPKGTPASTIANIAFVAIENVKVVGQMVTGKLSFKEGVEKIEQTTVSTVAGLAAMTGGAKIGAAVGSVFGPVGSAVGGFVGGTIGYMAGSKVGEVVVKGVQKIRTKAVEVIKTVAPKVTKFVSNVVDTVKTGVKNFCDGIKSIGNKIKNFFRF